MRTKKALLIGIAIAAGIFLTTCENALLLLEKLDDQVMVANDRYLEVLYTYPEQNDQNLSPRLEIELTLDRDVDPADLDRLKNFVQIEMRDGFGNPSELFGTDPEQSLDLEYNPTDKSLTISPEPFLNGGEKITITIDAGFQAADGTVLRDPITWSFYTVKMPVGVIDILDGSDGGAENSGAVSGYTRDTTPAAKITFSNSDEYIVVTEQSAVDAILLDPDDLSSVNPLFTWQPTSQKTGLKNIDLDWTSGVSDGPVTAYVIFRDTTSNTLSLVESDDTFLDTAGPVIEAGGNVGRTNLTQDRTVSVADASGFQKANWTSTTPGVWFGDQDGQTTGIRGPSGQRVSSMAISVDVTDNAGNVSATDSFSFYWDNQPPNAPTITTAPASPTKDVQLLFEWSGGTLGTGDSDGGYAYRVGSGRVTSTLAPRILYPAYSAPSIGTTSYDHVMPTTVGYYKNNFQVLRYDDLLNPSLVDSHSFDSYVVSPGHGTTRYGFLLIGQTTRVEWPKHYYFSGTPTYTLYYRKQGAASYSSVYTSKNTYYSFSTPSYGTYEWYYVAKYGKLIIHTSPVFTFSLSSPIIVLPPTFP